MDTLTPSQDEMNLIPSSDSKWQQCLDWQRMAMIFARDARNFHEQAGRISRDVNGEWSPLTDRRRLLAVARRRQAKSARLYAIARAVRDGEES